jgi:hypothetical protein
MQRIAHNKIRKRNGSHHETSLDDHFWVFAHDVIPSAVSQLDGASPPILNLSKSLPELFHAISNR